VSAEVAEATTHHFNLNFNLLVSASLKHVGMCQAGMIQLEMGASGMHNKKQTVNTLVTSSTVQMMS
jgi:hypothetical protein